MVYREPAEELARQAREAEAERGALTRLDASGSHGARGGDGATGGHGEGRGGEGRSGGDASDPERGGQGGQILLMLERATGANGDHVAHVHGNVTSERGVTPVDEEIDFTRAGEIELFARGGKGGSGGHGGRGGDGARGRRGSDATRMSSGGRGGPGGDGGDGGAGSSGAHGGPGGNVVVRVRDTDTHLLMLLASDVSGGNGGTSGENGRGGEGGEGGPGGASYSWSESESYTDSQGTRQSRSVSRHHAGGGRGSPGRQGRSSNAVLRDGARGPDGTFAIEVLAAGSPAAKSTKYASRYDVRLVALRHRNDNDDGIYEPEEKVFVSHVEVENVGGMPTPAHHDVRIGVVDDGWIAPADARLELPRSLGPGQRHVFEREELELKLRVFRPQESAKPLAEEATIRLFAELPDAKRRFADFETEATRALGKLLVRFPVEASPLVSLFSLAPGQAARVRWSITNVAAKTFGSESDLGRAVSVFVGIAGGSEVGADLLHFFDETGKHVPLDVGFRRAVGKIEPQQTISFEGTIAVSESAKTYTSARLFLAAELGHIEQPALVRPIQYQEVTVTVGRPFEARDADVLFITNNRSTAEEIAAWERFAASIGLSSAVWDVALEGNVAVLEAVARGERKYRLVVFLNNTMDTATGERRASVLLDKATSLVLARLSTHVLYVGRSPDLEDILVPTGDLDGDGDGIAIGDAPIAADADADADIIGGGANVIDVRVSYAWPWTEPKLEHLQKRAHALAAKLEKSYPDRRYIVVPRFDAVVEKRVAWVRHVKLGQLVVRRSTDPARLAISSIDVEPKEMHSPAFAEDPRTIAAATAALPFEAKLGLLAASVLPYGERRNGVQGCEDHLVAAALGDLVREQQLVARFGWRASREQLTRALPMLDAFARAAFPQPVTLGSDAGRRLIELAAWLELVARGHARWWEWVPPLLWLRRGPGLRAFVREAIARVLERASGGGADEAALKEVRDAVEKRVTEVQTAWISRKRAFEAPSSAAAYVLGEIADHGKGRHADDDALNLPPGRRVIDAARVDALARKERARRGRSSEVTAGAAKAQGELGRTESCAELLARAGVGAGAGAGAGAGDEERVRVDDGVSAGDFVGLRDEGEDEARRRKART